MAQALALVWMAFMAYLYEQNQGSDGGGGGGAW